MEVGGRSETLIATVAPPNATNNHVTWSTSDPNIAEVSNGMVTARKIGTAIITVETHDGHFKASCTVTVFKTPPIPPDPNPPTKPTDAPNDVEAKTPKIAQDISEDDAPTVRTAAAGAMEHIVSTDLEVVEGVLVVKESVGLKIAQQNDPANKVLIPLPVFSADGLTAGNVAMVSFGLSGDKLMASAPQNVKIMKVISADKGEFFKYQSDAREFTDKTFTIMSWGNLIWTGAIVPGGSYKLILFIKDGGNFDLDGSADTKIVDPAAIVGTSSTPGGGSSPTPSSAGGSGCAVVSTHVWWLLMGVIPLVVRRKK